MPKLKALKIIGCYGQTELGHGSNVAGLETTAKLDMKTNEWVINTPTISSYKFWPGAMGIFANHAIVYARCIVGTKDFGPKPFVVQIRSLENHMPCQGIQAGDLGQKMGFNATDNGFLAFD